MVRNTTIRGACEGCGKHPRVLVEIESGQRVCRSCRRRIRGPQRPKTTARPSQEQLVEAQALGLGLPPSATYAEAAQRIGLAKRQFPLTDELLAENYERLAALHDRVLCYAADVWEQLTGRSPDEAEIPWSEQQAFAALLIAQHRDLALIVDRIQRQRERRRKMLEAEHAAAHPGGPAPPPKAMKPPVAEDAHCDQIRRMLKTRWQEYLPQKPSLLRRWFGRRD